MVADRDIVVKVVGDGPEAGTFPAGSLNQSEAATTGADDSVEEALAMMSRLKVRRLPVIDRDSLVGLITLGDLARKLPHTEIGELVDALSEE